MNDNLKELLAGYDRSRYPWEGFRAEAWFLVGEVLAVTTDALARASERLERLTLHVNDRRRGARVTANRHRPIGYR